MRRSPRSATTGRERADGPPGSAAPVPTEQSARELKAPPKRPYRRPHLAAYGDLWARTSGMTGDIDDSSGKMLEDPFPFYGNYNDIP
jgi:hypothetical protein